MPILSKNIKKLLYELSKEVSKELSDEIRKDKKRHPVKKARSRSGNKSRAVKGANQG